MNDWYIDRSKNFNNNSLDPVINYLANYNGDYDSNSIISSLIENDVFDSDAGNLNAALTRFRDHGIINNSNRLGESSLDYHNRIITKDEFIIDLLLKRPATKKNSPNIKPLIVLCSVFDKMYEIVADEGDVFLSYEECYKYLYPINSLSEITIDYVDMVLSNRPCTNVNMTRNEIINISIWANALRNTPLVLNIDDKNIIKPNAFCKSFIRFLSTNGYLISETPTDSNDNLYNYYCRRETGISEIIPNTLKPNVVARDQKESKMIFDYLFGIKIDPEFNKDTFFESNCFGIYNSFLLLPGLALRCVWNQNKALGNSLFNALRRI